MNSSVPIRNHPSAGALLSAAPAFRPAATEAAPLASQPCVVLPSGLVQSNSTVWGGARHGGRREACGAAPFASRGVRIFSITRRSSLLAMILTAPPQAEQVSMSMPNTRFRRSAQSLPRTKSRGLTRGFGYRSPPAGR